MMIEDVEFSKETGFQDTPIGKTPRDWKTAKLEDVATYINGFHFGPTDWKSKGLPIIRIQNLNDKDAEFNYFQGDIDEKYIIENGDLLFSWSASIGAYVWNRGKAVLNQHIFKVVPKQGVDKLYLYHALFLAIQQLSSRVHGSTMKHFKKEELKTLIPLPPLREQSGIVGVLGVIDSAIELVDGVIWKTERLKKGLMQTLLAKGIGHKEYKYSKELDSEIPKEWEVAQLSQLLEREAITYHLDGNHGELYPREEEFVSEGVPFLSANMIVDGVIDFSKAKYVTEERARQFRKGVAKDGDVLFAHNATVGPVSILRINVPYVILGTTLTSYRCELDCLNNYYLKYYMESPHFQKQLQRIMKQTTRNQVPITAQRKLYFVSPPISEQKRIAEILSVADKKLETERKEKMRLERVKRGLMDLLLTGKVRVKVD